MVANIAITAAPTKAYVTRVGSSDGTGAVTKLVGLLPKLTHQIRIQSTIRNNERRI